MPPAWIRPVQGGTGGGGGGGGTPYQLGVETIAERNAIPLTDRTEYETIVYVYEIGQFFQLVGGVTNADWFWIERDRPTENEVGWLSTIYVDPATGSDTDGLGTALAPYQTVNRALAMIGTNDNNTLTNIEFASGTTTDLPQVLTNCNWINFKGPTPTNSDTGSISVVVAWASSGQLTLDLSLGLAYAANELRGRRITWTSGPMNGQAGWIYANDATAVGVTRVYVTQNNNTLSTPVAGNTVAIQSLGATVRFGANYVMMSSTQLNFTDLNVQADTTARIIFALSTDQVIFTGCFLSNFLRLQAGQNSGILLANSYLRNTGGSALGMLRATSNAFFQLNAGTVIDGSGAAVNGNFILNDNLSSFMYRGRVVFANMLRWEMNGAGASCGTGAATANDGAVYFHNCTNGFIINANTSGDGEGGYYSLPSLYGSVASNYCVTARQGAHVQLGSFTSITSLLGTNYVSANGGTSTFASWTVDGTYINGGYPNPNVMRRRTLVTAPGTYTVLTTDDVIIADATLGNITIQLPLVADTPGKTTTVKRVDNSVNTVTVIASGGQLIDLGASWPVPYLDSFDFFADVSYPGWWIT